MMAGSAGCLFPRETETERNNFNPQVLASVEVKLTSSAHIFPCSRDSTLSSQDQGIIHSSELCFWPSVSDT